MKKILSFFFMMNIGSIISAQVVSKANIVTDAGAYIVCPADFKNDTNGNVQNDGNIYVGGDFINNSTFNSGNISNVKLDGITQDIGGTNSTTFNNLIIDGTGNKNILINSSVADSLIFNANKILIAGFNLYLLPNAVITNANNQRFIVTNGTGNVIKKSLSLSADYLFPVGDTLSSYKPVILNYTGTIDTFAVRVEKGVNPTTGADQTCVQNTWVIDESATGGTTASLNLGWNTTDEGTLFFNSTALLWQNINSTWTSVAGTPGATANLPATDWYYQTTGITDFSSIADRFVVRTFSPPVITIQPANQTICAGDTISFSVTATGQGTLAYQWQENCGAGWSNLTNNVTYSGATTDSLVISNITTGCSYQCIVSNPAGSVTSDSVIATVNPLPTPANVGTLSYCEGDSTTLQTGFFSSYQWSTGSTSQSTNATIADNPVNVTVTDANGCTGVSSSVTVIANVGLPVSVSIAANDTTICDSTNVIFTATGTNGGISPTFQWYLNGSSVGTNSATYASSNLADNDIISCTLTSSETCVSGNPATSDSITMQVSTKLTPSVTIASIPVLPVCAGTSVTFKATTVNGGINPQIQWFLNTVYKGNGINYTPTNISGNDQIYCTLNSNLSCVSTNNVQSNILSVTLNPLPVIIATQQGESCAGSGDASINLNITQGTPPYTIHWDNPSVNADANAINLHSGTYGVTVTDSRSCTADTSIYISPGGSGCLFIPNVFSPNGDGKNDILFVRGSNIKSLSLKIYDRWGNKIFEANNQNDGWDGTYNGNSINTGVFVYYLKAEIESGKTVEEQGNITLLK